MTKILLNCMPPTSPTRPGYSLSVIKSYLAQYGYDVTVKYWNLALRKVIDDFWYGKYDDVRTSPIIKDLIPFYNYYAVTRNDLKAAGQIKKFLLRYFPDWTDVKQHMVSNKDFLSEEILSILEDMNVQQYKYV